jgi:hypothetical protein
MPTDTLTPSRARLRHTPADLREDLSMLRQGVLDPRGFVSGWKNLVNPVQVRTTSLLPDGARMSPDRIVRDPALFTRPIVRFDGLLGDAAFHGHRRYMREIRRTHNLQVDLGKNQIQRIQSFGDVGAGLNGSFAAYTGTTATTLTGSSGLPTGASAAGNTGLQGKLCYVQNATAANSVVGVIVSNTATAITVDQWYAIPLTGAAGTQPTNAAGTATILPGGTWALWVALSTNSSAAAAADVTRTADGLWGDGTSGGAATEQNASGLARAFCGQGGTTAPTFPATKQIALAHTWTYSTTGAVTLQKVILFNSLAFAGTLPLLETLLSASATVSANGDTLQVTWTITV